MSETTLPDEATDTVPPAELPAAEVLRQRLIRNLHDAPRRPFSWGGLLGGRALRSAPDFSACIEQVLALC